MMISQTVWLYVMPRD